MTTVMAELTRAFGRAETEEDGAKMAEKDGGGDDDDDDDDHDNGTDQDEEDDDWQRQPCDKDGIETMQTETGRDGEGCDEGRERR